MRISLKTYIDRVEDKYIKAREEWSEVQKKLKQEDERYQNINWSLYSGEGRKEEQAAHVQRKTELIKGLDEVRENFAKAVDDIKRDSDKVFNRAYQYTASDVDMNGVAILQNSSMNDNELMELAESYRKAGNYTMYFMVSEKLKKDKTIDSMNEREREAQAYYNKAKDRRQNREDHECLDNFREICLKALRDEDYLSDGIHGEHGNFYQKYSAISDEIAVNTSSPWSD